MPLHVMDGSYSNVWFAPDGQRVIAAYNLPDVVPGPGWHWRKPRACWINEAVEQANENSSYVSYQGFAYYRLGQYADSLTALALSKELHAAQKLSPPAEDLTIQAMVQHQTDQRDESRTTLEQARTSASRNKLAGQKLLAEAETLLGIPHATDNP